MGQFIDQLERLLNMGLAPIVGILLLFCLALAGVVTVLAAFGFKFFMGERRRHDALLSQRDKERGEERLAIESRLTASETRHETCERDRETLRAEVATLAERVARFTSCPKRDCPNRLP